MREIIVPALVLLCMPAWTQTVPAGWKPIKDSKAACQIAVPPEWAPLGDSSGAAVFHDAGTAIAVVTAQPGQDFKPLNAALLRVMAIPKEKMFENSTARIFYQERSSKQSEDPNAFNASVPAKSGTCSVHIVVLPIVTEDVAKKIALSLASAPGT